MGKKIFIIAFLLRKLLKYYVLKIWRYMLLCTLCQYFIAYIVDTDTDINGGLILFSTIRVASELKFSTFKTQIQGSKLFYKPEECT